MKKNCRSDNKYANDPSYICNNLTGRWVKKSGKIGMSLQKMSNNDRIMVVGSQKKKQTDGISTTNDDILINACNGRTASNNGLNMRELKLELHKKFPEHKKIIDDSKSRKSIEKLCLSLSKQQIKSMTDEEILNRPEICQIKGPIPLSMPPEKVKIKVQAKHKKLFPHIFANVTEFIGPLNHNDGLRGYTMAFYDEKRNLIIASKSDGSLVLYNMSNLEIKKSHGLASSVVKISYDEKTDDYLFGCKNGFIYIYDPSIDHYQMIYDAKREIKDLIHLDGNKFLFVTTLDKKIYLGVFKYTGASVSTAHSLNHICTSLHYQKEKKMLYSGFANGKMSIYNVDKIGNLSLIQTIQAHDDFVQCIISINLWDKDYVVTATKKSTIKIWTIVSGTVRLMKVIQIGFRSLNNIIYLPKYQVLAINLTYLDDIHFYEIPSGTKVKYYWSTYSKKNIFALNSSDSLGIIYDNADVVDILKLSKD